MALRGKVLHRLCHSMWRVNVSGSSGHADVLHHPSPPCRLQHWSSTLSRLPHPPSARTASLPPPCLHAAKESSFNVSLRTNLRVTGTGVVETDGHTHHRREANTNVLDVRSNIAGLRIHDVNQRGQSGTRSCWDLASWPNGEHTEYVCPSEKLTTLPELVILEQLPRTIPYDLPQTSNIVSRIIDPTSTSTEISEPTDANTRNAPKEARQIMKIRRKKMKRHLLKKFRKRMAFTLRKIKRERRKKKEAVFQTRLSKIRDWGESFSAGDWVQDQLDRARRGGFFINVLEKRQGQRQGE